MESKSKDLNKLSEEKKNQEAILFILDSNLKFQSIALLSNLLETQSLGRKILIFYVYDHEHDRKDYSRLLAKILNNFRKQEDTNVHIEFISTEEADDLTKSFILRDDFPITRTAFLRLFLTRWLPPDIFTVLYIDIDILITKNIDELFNRKFSTPICAELNVPKSLARGDHLKNFDAPYFNSGVLLIDINKWKNLNLESKILEIGSHQAYPFLDQDILNIIFKNNWTRLGREFNYLHIFKLDEFDQSFSENPSIIHFIGTKPWKNSIISYQVHQYRSHFNSIRAIDPQLAD